MELTDLEHLDLDEARQLIPFFDPALFKIKTVIKPEHIASILDTTGSAPSVDRKWPHDLTEKYVDDVITSYSDGKYILAERTVLEGMGHGRATETREAFMGQKIKISGHGPLFPFGEEMLIEHYTQAEMYGITIANSAFSTLPEAKWLALNPYVAFDLGLKFKQDNGNFSWINKKGEVVVESIFWRLGDSSNKAGHHNSEAGYGWLVIISEGGMKSILGILGDTQLYHYKKVSRHLQFIQKEYGTDIDEEGDKLVVNKFDFGNH